MNRLRLFALVVSILVFGLEVARAQVKLAQVSGSPGSFNAFTGVALSTTSNIGYVTNSGSGVVQKFRPSTGEILGSLQLVQGIGPATLSHDERTLIVLGVNNQRIYIIDTLNMQVKRETGYQPSGFTGLDNLVISPDGVKFFIADPSRDQVAVFNVADGSIDRFLNVGINPNIQSLLPNGRQVAVLCSGKKAGDEESVYLIDTLTLNIFDVRVLTSFNTEPFNNIQFTATGSSLFVPSYNDNRIAVYDLKSYVLGSRSSYGKGPSKASTSPNGRFLAVINLLSKDIALLSLPEALVVTTISIPGVEFTSDTTLAWSADGHTLFIPSRATGEIVSYDVENLKIRDRFPTGRGPTLLQLSGDGHVLTSLDLTDNVLSLIALNPTPLYIPHLTQTAKDYAGIAVANFGSEAANVAFIAKSNTGALLPGTTNPRLLTVPPGHQISLVLAQIFGFNPLDTLNGCIDAYTLGQAVTILYMTGTIDQSQLGGFVADSTTSKLLGFPRITEGVLQFGTPTSTEIILQNLSNTEAALVYRMYAKTLEGPGSMIAYIEGKLPARARIQSRISQLIPTPFYPLDAAYLEINSDQPLKGMEIVRIGSSLALIHAIPRGLPDTTFAAAQFASGGAGVLDTPIYSNLSLCNSAAEPLTVTMQVTDAEGKPVPPGAKPTVRTLLPYEAVSGGADTLLGFPNPNTDPKLYQGTLQMTVDKKGLLPDLLYGDARDGRYITSANLHVQYGTKFALAHLAEGRFGDPAKGMFTGIAMYNPNRNFVNLVIEAYGPTSAFLGRSNLILERGGRLSQTLGQIIPAIKQQNGGTITITSDLPITVFEVFGSSESQFLVAVQPILLQP